MSNSNLTSFCTRNYLAGARAKGLKEYIVVLRHALPNALTPALKVIGLQGGRVLGGSVVIETVFGLPGVGRLAADSIFFRGFASTQAIVLFVALAVLVANLLTDLTYAAVDPRIRLG